MDIYGGEVNRLSEELGRLPGTEQRQHRDWHST